MAAFRSLASSLAVLVACVALAAADGFGQKSYLIKGRPVADAVDASVQMTRFLSARLSPAERCQRRAVLLEALKKKKLNSFEVADIALARKDDIERRYNQMNAELLRNLYIEAIELFMGHKHVDESMMELVDCLKDGFKSRDAIARSFLNGPQLNTIVDQYAAISSQPVRLLSEPNFKHPALQLKQLAEPIRESVLNWMAGDRARLVRVFNEPEQEVADAKQTRDLQGQGPLLEPLVAAAAPPTDDADQEYIETLFGSLMAVYEMLPFEAQLSDRCQTYEQLIEAEREDLFRDGFIDEVLAGARTRLERNGPTKGVYVPDEKTREDFIFVADTFDPLLAGDEVWLDIDGCVQKWQNNDESALNYLLSPKRTHIIETLTKAHEAHGEALQSAGAEQKQQESQTAAAL